uniref:VWFA domain-containing protein n=1 Tax=Oryza brachyantha TaxID=4533 RepID=J3N0U8_ORYBR
MVLEATVICVDDSEWMRNGDYPPTRLRAQAAAANLVFHAKMEKNEVKQTWLLLSGFAQLVLKNRPNKSLCQRIVVLVGSPVKDEKNVLEAIGKRLKKDNVSLDVVDFGESDDQKPEKLEALVAAVNIGDNSHIVHIPPGEDALHDVLANTIPFTGDEGGGAAEGGASRFEYGVDPNVDPELAEGLRFFAEEDRARQEAAASGASRFEYSVDPNVDPVLAEALPLFEEEFSKTENKCTSSISNTGIVPSFDCQNTYVPFLE